MVRMTFGKRVFPGKKLTKRSAAMAILGFLFSGQFGERLADLRKKEQWIVTEPVRTPRRPQNQSLSFSVENGQRVAITSGGNHAHKTPRPELVRHLVQLAQQTPVVRLIVGVA